MVHELAGQKAPQGLLADIPKLIAEYYDVHPDPEVPEQRISFGTSGHRGSSLVGSFNEDHILAACQALCEYRQSRGIDGPLFIGRDTHALSEPAEKTAVEVFAANDLEFRVAPGVTPTPVVSHAILSYNRGRKTGLADGVVITPSHNPPQDGGFKYNPPSGGPAGPEITSLIEERANEILSGKLKAVRRMPYGKALQAGGKQDFDFATPYIRDLSSVIDLEMIASSGLRIGVDPMGGAAVDYWDVIADGYGLDISVVNRAVDPAFAFMSVDHDGKIRMDCSSPYAMAGLVGLKDAYDIAFGNDPDVDRHGIVTPSAGLMNPNHYLSVAVWYLFQHRSGWKEEARVGKTLVSSSLIDRVAVALHRELAEVAVGFKWFVDGLADGSFGFGGEESAGASFLRKDGTVWTTDKDGILLNLLAAEITALTGRDPGVHYVELTERFGDPVYRRIDQPASKEQKALLKELSPEAVAVETLAGEAILTKLTRAPFNGIPIGGLKVVTENGWFAARPSGTEDIYKIYAESFLGETHLEQVLAEAREIVDKAFRSGR
ncbi:MAG: alpha-D-glucose phosphate-specific phosphoglucomutase [Anaerolineales bacterium]|nr:alpha-D-glucose phosphate-specific phosphoglucomutase [Anaerolineales bacterium]